MEPARKSIMENLRILIIEDEENARKVTAKYLCEYGSCDTAENGEEGMELFIRAREEGNPYHVIFLDILMPKMSGRRVLDRIREIEDRDNLRDSERARIIMTSSLSDPRSISRAFKSRCEGYLVKPFGRKDLEEQLQSLGLLKDPA
ncbi:MAG: response regulator [Candidatus Latescibacteria bacterium]|nr:response regulator [bacterium]MBD3424319.1 response regulator [Candidatus Latescibacterota bacterium]